jgi:hypothetical protein
MPEAGDCVVEVFRRFLRVVARLSRWRLDTWRWILGELWHEKRRLREDGCGMCGGEGCLKGYEG